MTSRQPNRRTIDDLLAEARAGFVRVEPADLAGEIAGGALVVDIRPDRNRVAEGHLDGAVVIDRLVLEWRLDPASEHRIPELDDGDGDGDSYDRRIIVMCNEGYASSLAVATLHEIGLRRATDLAGGFRAVCAQGLGGAVSPSGGE